MTDLAIVTLTPAGAALAERLARAVGGERHDVAGNTREQLTSLFQAGQPLVCIMALGIVVRVLGPLTVDKRTDPPVVVVDELGQFAISVLGGHGGANALATRVADALGGTAVITTASDTHGLPAVDLIGQGLGWAIGPGSDLTRVAAAVVSGQSIAVFQEVGDPEWWRPFGAWPASFHRIATWPPGNGAAAALCISDRVLPPASVPTVWYRPRQLVVGTGCKRGTPLEEIDAAFRAMMDAHGFLAECVAVVVSVTLKADEPGLRAFAARLGVPLICYSPDELADVPGTQRPSEAVRARIGILGVAEPAALRAAGSSFLLVPKQKHPRVTMALARGGPS
jgi:cobalt-precorrin 5A hydrolase